MANEEIFIPQEAEEKASARAEAQKHSAKAQGMVSNKTSKQAAREAQKGRVEVVRELIKEYVPEEYGRPLIVGGLGTVGATLASPMGPLGMFAGGALGTGAGENLADIIYSPEEAPKTFREVPEKFADYMYEGATSELLGLGLGSAIGGTIKGTGKLIGKGLDTAGKVSARRAAGDIIRENPNTRSFFKDFAEDADLPVVVDAYKRSIGENPPALVRQYVMRHPEETSRLATEVGGFVDDLYSRKVAAGDYIDDLERTSEDMFQNYAGDTGRSIIKTTKSPTVHMPTQEDVHEIFFETYENILDDIIRPSAKPKKISHNIKTSEGKNVSVKKEYSVNREQLDAYLTGVSGKAGRAEAIEKSPFLSDEVKGKAINTLHQLSQDLAFFEGFNAMNRQGEAIDPKLMEVFQNKIKNLDDLRSSLLQDLYQMAKGSKPSADKDINVVAKLLRGVDSLLSAETGAAYTNPWAINQLEHILGPINKNRGKINLLVDNLLSNKKAVNTILELPGGRDMLLNLGVSGIANKAFYGNKLVPADVYEKRVNEFFKKLSVERPFREPLAVVAESTGTVLRVRDNLYKRIGVDPGTSNALDAQFKLLTDSIGKANTPEKRKGVFQIIYNIGKTLEGFLSPTELGKLKLGLAGAVGSNIKGRLTDKPMREVFGLEQQPPEQYPSAMTETTQPPVRLQDLGTIRSK